ncbi:MAG: branched-chain amino acid transaminase [Deltaproteobacteria bacterium]|nr:branched-chain amino acid transaminase [Deltaproteobacteria bacterium]
MAEQAGKIWFDGKLVNWEAAQVHVMTHTLHYGLGVFEGIRCYQCTDGRSAIFRLREHVRRLFDSAAIAQITMPFSRPEIEAAIGETLRANKLPEGYIRPIVFLGDGSRGLYPKDNPTHVAIVVWAWGAYLGAEGLRRGIRVKIASFARHHVNVGMTKAKICGNYVNSILAKREAVAAGYDEALLLDTEGYVSEGSGENIFMVRDGLLKTTPLTSILPGITRDVVLTLARRRGVPVCEERFTRDELYTADEAFFTGTAAEITPIREVDGRPIGEGKPGPIAQQLQSAFFNVVKGGDPEFKEWLTYV